MSGRTYTHASFFSGVGGLDLGFERAGWRTVSLSEIDPYANAVLRKHWPDIPNLGDITRLAERDPKGRQDGSGDAGHGGRGRPADGDGGSVRDPDALGGGGILDLPRERTGSGPRRGGDGSRPGAVGGGRSEDDRSRHPGGGSRGELRPLGEGGDGSPGAGSGDADTVDWRHAVLWSGGFPCQDLSIAGKRRGFGAAAGRARAKSAREGERSDARAGEERSGPGAEGGERGFEQGADGDDGASDEFFGDHTRSGLAFAFLDLVERHRPPVVLLENVPGLLSSHGGRDLSTLLQSLGELGYGWAYRVLDARHFGVPQRRRRVFILGIHASVDPSGTGASEVLSLGTRCHRHPPSGDQAWQGAAGSVADGADYVGTISAAYGHHGYQLGQEVWTGMVQVANAITTSQGRNNLPGDQEYVVGAVRAGGHGDPGIGRDGDERRLVIGAVRASGGGYPVSADDEGRLVVADGVDDGGTGERVRVGERAEPDPQRDPAVGHGAHPVRDQEGSVGQAADAGRGGAPDGLAGRLDDRGGVVYPISGDALRGEGVAATPSADAEGRVRLRDPGLGIGRGGDPAYTVNATEPGAIVDVAPTLTAPDTRRRSKDGKRQDGSRLDSIPIVATGDGLARPIVGHQRYDEDITTLLVEEEDFEEFELVSGGERSYHQRDRIYSDLAPALDAYAHSAGDPPLVAFRKATKAREVDGEERWEQDDLTDTFDATGMGALSATAIVEESPTLRVGGRSQGAGSSYDNTPVVTALDQLEVELDPLLPQGLDSHRYRCCGNGVVSGVTEWIGLRLIAYLDHIGLTAQH